MELSIIVPVYRSEECLPELARRVQAAVSGHFRDYELILVNDASPDASWQVISSLADTYPFVVGVNLRKNVGQDNAIMAGMHHATGEAVVVMDDDLQHDPADIPALCRALRGGADVAYAAFDQKRQALWKNLGSWFNDRVAVVVLGKPKDVYLSPYKALRREIVDEIVKYDGPFTYVDGIIFNITSNITQVPATHHSRFAGRSNYNLFRSIRVWLKLATGFSVIPLRIATIIGGVISLLSPRGSALHHPGASARPDSRGLPVAHRHAVLSRWHAVDGARRRRRVRRPHLSDPEQDAAIHRQDVVRHPLGDRREAHADRMPSGADGGRAGRRARWVMAVCAPSSRPRSRIAWASIKVSSCTWAPRCSRADGLTCRRGRAIFRDWCSSRPARSWRLAGRSPRSVLRPVVAARQRLPGFRIAARTTGRAAGLLAAVLFCLIYQGYGPWNTAQREGFALLFVLAGYWLYSPRERRAPMARPR